MKIHGTEYGTSTGSLWKAKYGYGINYGTYTGFISIYKSNVKKYDDISSQKIADI